tara:strand:- start:2442 stop:2720 length:279 start_codon:yes stop_codon:yes gene_type:complete
MISTKMIVNFLLALVTLFFLSLEKIRLSWEVSTLYNNNEILNVEHENLKDMNLQLITQFHIEHSPANIEKIAKENLGMIKKRPKEITNEKER